MPAGGNNLPKNEGCGGHLIATAEIDITVVDLGAPEHNDFALPCWPADGGQERFIGSCSAGRRDVEYVERASLHFKPFARDFGEDSEDVLEKGDVEAFIDAEMLKGY